MSKKCNFHNVVKKKRRISHHLAIYEDYPIGFHALIKKNIDKTDDVIFGEFLKLYKFEKEQEMYFNYTQEEVKKYIKMVKDKYIAILK